MTKVQDLQALVKTGQATPAYTKRQLLDMAAAAFASTPNTQFRTIRNVEHFALDKLRAQKTGGTVLQPVRKALGDAGIEVDGTVGGLMDALDIDQAELHHVVCYCHENSDTMSGELAAQRFAGLAQRAG